MHFKFCPQCGAELSQCPFGDDGFVPWCANCDHPYFDLFPVVTITLVVNELGEVALINQKYLSEQYCNFVSGYIKPGESAEECARREVYEEIGVTVTDLHFVCSCWDKKQQMLLTGFIAHGSKTKFALSREVNAARWVRAEKAIDLVYPEGNITHTLLEMYLKKQGERGKNAAEENSRTCES